MGKQAAPAKTVEKEMERRKEDRERDTYGLTGQDRESETTKDKRDPGRHRETE
jgi:hypothetical protein